MAILNKRFAYSFSNVALLIIVVNCVVFALTSLFNDVKVYLAMCPALVIQKRYVWQFFTYMFAHAGFGHLFSNMLALLFFGTQTERALGSKEFLLLYFASGILSGLLTFFYYVGTGQYVVFLVGASGAIYGVLLVYAVVFPRAKIFLWGLLPIPSPLFVVLYAGIELFGGLSGTGNVAHYTHLFGLAVAYLYCTARLQMNPIKVWKDAYR